MLKASSAELFSCAATCNAVTEEMKKIMKIRQKGVKQTLETVWKKLWRCFVGVNTGKEGTFSDVIKALSNAKSVRVCIKQARVPFADRNGRQRDSKTDKASGGVKLHKLKQCLAVNNNTIAQLLKNQDHHKKLRGGPSATTLIR